MAEHHANGNSIWEYWYDVLFHPLTAMQKVSSQRCKGRALITMILSLCPLWLVYLAAGENAGNFAGLFMGLHIAAGLLVWLCGSAVLHLAAALAGGRGEAVGLFCSLGYVGLPQIFLIPAAAFTFCLPQSIRTIALALALTMLVLWTAALKVLAIRGCYGFSTARSLLVLVSPILALMAFAVLGVILLSASVLSMAI